MDDSWTTAVVFSHLRWDFVYERPQQVFSRLGARRRILFVEEPVHDPGGSPRWERRVAAPNVIVHRPYTPVAAEGFAEAQLPVLARLVRRLRTRHRDERLLAWLYTPLALPLARLLDPVHVVYDCMDELSASLHAPPETGEREQALLGYADVVFTAGPSLHGAKMAQREDVYCLPSSVDAEHFARARRGRLREAADQARLPHPRLGFYGVLDERIDGPLLAAVADARPDWQLVMVGPVANIAPESLPQRPNIHYLGARAYRDLPAYLSGWDVCLLPFARNAATRCISPTQTLEYMAAERPIVGTPITDVAEPYGHIVYLGDTPAGFVAACERALGARQAERTARTAAMRTVRSRTSWDATVRTMEELIAALPPARRTEGGSATWGADRSSSTAPARQA